MMKTLKPLLLFLVLSLLCVGSVCGQDETDAAEEPVLVSDEMITILSSNLENIFPLNSLKKNFMEPAEALYSDVGPQTMVRKETENGKRLILLIANEDGVHEYSAFDTIDEAYPNDFQLTIDVTVSDVYPEGQGGCFVGFTNEGVSALSSEDSPVMINLLITGKALEIYVKQPDEEAGQHISLGELTRPNARVSIIHLTGHTYAYVNGQYMGQFHDGIRDNLRLIYGSSVFTEGDTADCTFDNLLIRKVSVQ